MGEHKNYDEYTDEEWDILINGDEIEQYALTDGFNAREYFDLKGMEDIQEIDGKPYILDLYDLEKYFGTPLREDREYTDVVLTRQNLHHIKFTRFNKKTHESELYIPPAYMRQGKWYKITEIADGLLFNDEYIYAIIIPNTVTKIGHRAFMWCDDLKVVLIDENVKEIDEEAFIRSDRSTPVIKVSKKNPYYYDIDGKLFKR